MVRRQVTTVNIGDDICGGRQTADLLEVISTRQPEVILIQNAEKTNLRKALPNTYATNQVMTSEASRGSAVAWRRNAFDVGQSDLIIGSPGEKRRMSVVTLNHKDSSQRTRFVSLHFPERNESDKTHATMVSNMLALIKAKKIPNFIIGGTFSFNVSTDKYNIRKKTGLISRQDGSNGFYMTSESNPSSITTGPTIRSPHSPVTITIDM